MDYLGAEISKKIKSAIRAKLVELGVYVDDELPDYIMVLVANKKTKSQMEHDLTLFLSDHTIAFVQWLQEVLDKLQTITLAKDRGDEDKSSSKGSSTKEREKKRKSSDVNSESAKKSRPDDSKDKERKRSSTDVHKSKKDKDTKHTDKDSKHTEKDSKNSDATSSKKKDERTKSRESRDVEEPRTKSRDSRERRAPEEKTRDREKTAPAGKSSEPPSAPARSSRSSRSPERDSGSEGRRQRRRSAQHGSAAAAAAESKKHPRISAPAEPATGPAPPADEEDDQDVLNLSAEEDELVKEAPPAAAPRQPAPTSAAAPAAAAPRQLTVKPTPVAVTAPTTTSSSGGGSGGRMVNLREESSMFSRRVVAEEAPAVRRRSSRSRSPVRRREVKVTDTESRWSRRGPQSSVGAVVSREVEDAEYDPLNPAVGAVASTVRVTERPRRPASQQPRPTLLLKAMRDAQRSTVASVRPFLVRAPKEQPKQQQRNKRETRELYSASRQRRMASSAGTPSANGGAPRAVQARSQRSGSPGQIAITVRNSAAEAAPAAVGASPGRRRRRRSRQTGSPPAPRPESPPSEPTKMVVEPEKPEQSPGPPSSDEEDTVHVTIGKVKAHPHRSEPPPSEVPEYRPTPVLTSVDDISAIVHAVTNRIRNPPPQTDRSSSPTFVVTMTGLGASRFARSIDSDTALGAEDPPQTEVVEEEEEEEEELEEEDLRAQLLEERARKRAHPVIAPPDKEQEAPASTPKPTVARCRFWPNCKLASECTFHHPSVPCKTFPACKFGDACMYVHPTCKFGGSCTRRDCKFTHTTPRTGTGPAAAAAAPTPQFGGGAGNRPAARPGSITAECKFFPNCTNPACPFIHPKMCRYGEACTNSSCLFSHPTPALAGGRPQFKWVAPGAI